MSGLQPLGDLLGALAGAAPSAPAITCEGRSITRAELESRSNRLARAYESLGVGFGDLVSVTLGNGIEFYEACFAIWKLGATPQPLSPRLPERERMQLIELGGASLVVGTVIAGRPSVAAGFEPDAALPDEALESNVAPAWKAMSSGGSTGTPKLILSGTRGEVDPEAAAARFNARPGQRHLVPGPLYHDGPFRTSMSGLYAGQHLIVMARFDAREALELIDRERIQCALFVPTMLQRMLRVLEEDPARYDLSSLETVWHSAAPCPAWLKEAWLEILGPEKVVEGYSSTEQVATTSITGTEWLTHRGSVGRVKFGEIKIVGPDGESVPPGVIGEVYMRAGADAPPTYRYVGAQGGALPGGWESVGDLGSMDPEGYLYLADRRTDLIIAGGANIYPAEVEAALSEHPQVLSCAVVGLPDDDLGQRVHAVVQIAQPVDEVALRAFLAERLVRYKVPRTFRFVADSLRDEAGKVRRQAIREVELEALDQSAAPSPARH